MLCGHVLFSPVAGDTQIENGGGCSARIDFRSRKRWDLGLSPFGLLSRFCWLELMARTDLLASRFRLSLDLGQLVKFRQGLSRVAHRWYAQNMN